jgi:predicted RNase H-like nuclease (RuvC/YqgF family)
MTERSDHLQIETNRREIEKLRVRCHEHGNHIQILIARNEQLSKENDDLHDEVDEHDRELSRIKGIGIAAITIIPFLLWALTRLVEAKSGS